MTRARPTSGPWNAACHPAPASRRARQARARCGGLFFGGNGYSGASATVAPDGTLYLYDSYSFGGEVRRSSDRGATWQTAVDAGTLTATFTAGTLSAGPEGDVLLTVNNATGGGLYLITDGGTVVQKVSSGISGIDVLARFSRVHSGYAYANRGNATAEGFFSMNGGQSWMQSAAHAAQGDWALDPVTGAGYRFGIYDGGLNLERANDMRAPTWSRLPGGFFAGQGVPQPYDRVDAVGNSVLAVVGQRLFVSADLAQSFRRVGTLPPVVSVAVSLDSADGARVLLTDNRANVYESTDQGQSYVLKYSPPSLPTVATR